MMVRELPKNSPRKELSSKGDFQTMISRPSQNLPEQLTRARHMFFLSHADFAKELRIRPEWLSKILHGHVPPSYNIGLRLEDFLRRKGVDPAALEAEEPRRESNGKGAPNSAPHLRFEILALSRRLTETAKDDIVRLELILGKLRELCAQKSDSLGGSEKEAPRGKKILSKIQTSALAKAPPWAAKPNGEKTTRPNLGAPKQTVISVRTDPREEDRKELRRKLLEYRRRSSEK